MILIIVILALALVLLVVLGSRRARRPATRPHDTAPDTGFVVLPDPGFGTRPESFAPGDEADSFTPGGADFGGAGSSGGWDDAGSDSGGDGSD